jgi:hypothetical protein
LTDSVFLFWLVNRVSNLEVGVPQAGLALRWRQKKAPGWQRLFLLFMASGTLFSSGPLLKGLLAC